MSRSRRRSVRVGVGPDSSSPVCDTLAPACTANEDSAGPDEWPFLIHLAPARRDSAAHTLFPAAHAVAGPEAKWKWPVVDG